MKAQLNIETETLKYYIQNSQISLDDLHSNFPDLHKFVSGEKQPTFKQLSDISKKINVPTGLLLLKKTVDTETKRLKFRTLDSDKIQKMSPELRDTVLEMQAKQEFLQGEIDETIPFLGKFDINSNVHAVVESIRENLRIPMFWQKAAESNPLNYFRKNIGRLGIFVFFNGKIKDNTHRILKVSEFRGFVLSDEKAPIIFINQKDTKNGQLFTLIHELVHLYIGVEEIFNDNIYDGKYTFDKTEAFVNKVTGEILVPEKLLSDTLEKGKDISALSQHFKVSKFVIVRRLLDTGNISHQEYKRRISILKKEFEEIEKENSKASKPDVNGNYNNNLNFRIDKRFFSLVNNAVNLDKITYTDAFNIIGTGIKGYKTLSGEK